MVWTHGMAEWKPAGEIEGLFERRGPLESPESLAPAADPYSPPQQESPENFMAKEGGWPGARWRRFLVATLIFPFAWAIGSPEIQQQIRAAVRAASASKA
jgi:hypothetical protein